MNKKIRNATNWAKQHWILFIIVIILILGVVYFRYFNSLPSFDWAGFFNWLGITDYTSPKIQPNHVFQRGKTVWDFLELLIVPLALSILVLWFNKVERVREARITLERTQDVVLREYFDRMSDLLLNKDLRNAKEISGKPSEVQVIARALSIAVLSGLDGYRKGLVLKFLYEANLIGSREDKGTIIKLNGANFSGISAQEINLGGAVLLNTNFDNADFTRANLSMNHSGGTVTEYGLDNFSEMGTKFGESSLRNATLREADLTKAFLRKADLTGSDMQNAKLIGANLINAILEKANLQGADLSRANLHGANLRGAKVNDSQLARAATLNEAILPDGSSYDGRFDKLKGLD